MAEKLKESQLGCILVDTLQLMQNMHILPKDIVLEHVPNETRHTGNAARDIAWHRSLSKQGRIKGFSDYIVWYGGGTIALLELKRAFGSKQSPEQIAFQELSAKMTTPYLCTFELTAAIEFVAQHYPNQSLIRYDNMRNMAQNLTIFENHRKRKKREVKA